MVLPSCSLSMSLALTLHSFVQRAEVYEEYPIPPLSIIILCSRTGTNVGRHGSLSRTSMYRTVRVSLVLALTGFFSAVALCLPWWIWDMNGWMHGCLCIQHQHHHHLSSLLPTPDPPHARGGATSYTLLGVPPLGCTLDLGPWTWTWTWSLPLSYPSPPRPVPWVALPPLPYHHTPPCHVHVYAHLRALLRTLVQVHIHPSTSVRLASQRWCMPMLSFWNRPGPSPCPLVGPH